MPQFIESLIIPLVLLLLPYHEPQLLRWNMDSTHGLPLGSLMLLNNCTMPGHDYYQWISDANLLFGQYVPVGNCIFSLNIYYIWFDWCKPLVIISYSLFLVVSHRMCFAFCWISFIWIWISDCIVFKGFFCNLSSLIAWSQSLLLAQFFTQLFISTGWSF